MQEPKLDGNGSLANPPERVRTPETEHIDRDGENRSDVVATVAAEWDHVKTAREHSNDMFSAALGVALADIRGRAMTVGCASPSISPRFSSVQAAARAVTGWSPIQSRRLERAALNTHSNRVSSNQSLRCRETEFLGQRQTARKGPELKAWRSGDETCSRNRANSGLFAGNREISVRTRIEPWIR